MKKGHDVENANRSGKSRGGRKPRDNRRAIDGLILVNKPKGITSFDVIRNLRAILKFRKMGHLGTLDPNATGLLPICSGKATRLSRFLMNSDKTYIAMVRLGRTTTTYDADGDFTGETIEPPELTPEQLHAFIKPFIGEITQTPPLYSAKKVDGKRLYEYAREGKQIKPKACNVRVDEVIVLDQAPDMLKLEISSSSGMYVRSLAHDLGQSIGCGAYLEDLVRVRVGPFKLEDSVTLEDIEKMASGNDLSFVTPVGNMLPHMQRVDINRAQLERVRNGNHVVVFNPTLTDGQQVRLFDSTGTMVALGEVQRPLGSMQLRVQPKVVLI